MKNIYLSELLVEAMGGPAGWLAHVAQGRSAAAPTPAVLWATPADLPLDAPEHDETPAQSSSVIEFDIA